YFGPSPDSNWLDFDLLSAYPTALASIGMPRWKDAVETRVINELIAAGTMGFARVQFRFPPGTRFPCLPVRMDHHSLLLFPLEGETCVTAPELRLAVRLGCEITVLHGVVIPVDPSDRPFEGVVRSLIDRRQTAKNVHDPFAASIWKLVVNNFYGKIGQGLGSRRLEAPGRENSAPTVFSQVVYAAQLTGLVRAAVGELLAGLPVGRHVLSVTTDGILTDAGMEEIESISGDALDALRMAAERLRGNRQILESKHKVRQVLSWRTRGQATLVGCVGECEVVLAKAGISAPPDRREKADQNQWITGLFFDREPHSVVEKFRRPSKENLGCVRKPDITSKGWTQRGPSTRSGHLAFRNGWRWREVP
ncbi:MAG: DNA polymerase, partial [Verrucomicrobiales bacterium]